MVGAMLAAVVVALLQTDTKPDLSAGPTYNGKTVTAWIDSIQMANAEDAAVTNLVAIGAPALPYLIRATEWTPSRLDQLGRFVWKHAGWAAPRLHLPHPEEIRRRSNSKRGALHVLARLGPVAKDALPALRRVWRDPDWGNRAFGLSAIATIGPEPKDIPLLIKALNDKHRIVRIQGARGLGNLGFQSQEATRALRQALRDEDEGVRKFVSATLMKIDPKAAGEAGLK